jgi:hypothetical protein
MVGEGDRMPEGKRPPIAVLMVALTVGLAGVFRVVESPSFALYRVVDVVQLVGSGGCFGVTMMGMIFMLRRPRS